MTPSSSSSRRTTSCAESRDCTNSWRLWLLMALAAAPLPLLAQDRTHAGNGYYFSRPAVSLTVRGGYDRALGGSDIYDFTTTNLTLNKGDFAAFGYQLDFGIRLSDRSELVLSGGAAQRSADSEFRKYVDNKDLPIQQTTTLRRVPLSVGVKYALANPETRISRFAWIPARIVPWIGAGGGAMNYSFSQNGDFVDFQTLNVISQNYRSAGWAPMGYANVGLDLKLATRLSLTGDVRYTYSKATLSGPFQGFDKIDLSGTAATMGFTVRM